MNAVQVVRDGFTCIISFMYFDPLHSSISIAQGHLYSQKHELMNNYVHILSMWEEYVHETGAKHLMGLFLFKALEFVLQLKSSAFPSPLNT